MSAAGDRSQVEGLWLTELAAPVRAERYYTTEYYKIARNERAARVNDLRAAGAAAPLDGPGAGLAPPAPAPALPAPGPALPAPAAPRSAEGEAGGNADEQGAAPEDAAGDPAPEPPRKRPRIKINPKAVREADEQEARGENDDNDPDENEAPKIPARRKKPKAPAPEAPEVTTRISKKMGGKIGRQALETGHQNHRRPFVREDGEWQSGWETTGLHLGAGGQGSVFLFRRYEDGHVVDRCVVKDAWLNADDWSIFYKWHGPVNDLKKRVPMETHLVRICSQSD